MSRGYTLSEAYAELKRAEAFAGFEGAFDYRAAHVAAARGYLEDEYESATPEDAEALRAAEAAVRAAEAQLERERAH